MLPIPSANAKAGGRFAHATNREPSHFDGKAQGQVQLNTFNQLAYEALVSNKPGEGTASTWTEVLPELADDGVIDLARLFDGLARFHLAVEPSRRRERDPSLAVEVRDLDLERRSSTVAPDRPRPSWGGAEPPSHRDPEQASLGLSDSGTC